MLIAYGISKGVMSSLADKTSPKVFMACGLVLRAIVNVGLGFSSAFWIFTALVVFNGLFQGMGVGPSFITHCKLVSSSRARTRNKRLAFPGKRSADIVGAVYSLTLCVLTLAVSHHKANN